MSPNQQRSALREPARKPIYLRTKLQPPVLQDTLVQREALLQRLEKQKSQPLSVVMAPAGSGKSTLMALWAQNNSSPCAWLSLDSYDNDPSRLFGYIVTAIQSIVPGFGERILESLRASPPPPLPYLLATLLHQLDSLEDPFVLFLDDYHSIQTPEIHEMMASMLEHWPAQGHLCVGTREPLPWLKARWRLHHHILEIDANTLSFSFGETQALVQDVMNVSVAPKQLQQLHQTTEGWIAGLQLALLSQRYSPQSEPLQALSLTKNQHLEQYLMEEVFLQQPKELQQFFLETSILPQLNPSLCRAVTELQHSGSFLKELWQSQLFVIALDSSQTWYRYHHLWGDWLLQQLQTKAPEREAVLHQRACQWWRQQGLWKEACNHSLQAQDFDTLEDLFVEFHNEIIGSGEFVLSLGWAEQVPEDKLKQMPQFQLVCILLQSFMGVPIDYESLLNQLEQNLRSQMEQGDKEKQAQTQALLAQTLLMQASLMLEQSHSNKAAPLLEQALTWLSPQDDYFYIQARLLQTMVFTELYEPLQRTMQELQNLEPLLRSYPPTHTHVMLHTYTKLGALVEAGELQQALSLATNTISSWDDNLFIHENPMAGLILSALGYIYVELFALDKVEECFQPFLQNGALHSWLTQDTVLSSLGLLAHWKGNQEQAHQHFHSITQFITHHIPVHFTLTGLVQGRCWYRENNTAALQQWLEHHPEMDQCIASFFQSHHSLHKARLSLLQENYSEGLEHVEPILKECREDGRWLTYGEALVCKALLLHETQSHHSDAFSSLVELIQFATPQRWKRVFLEYEGIMPLLSQLLSPSHASSLTDSEQAFVREILTDASSLYASSPSAPLPATTSPEPSTTSPPDWVKPLSKREKEVLLQVREGLSNQDISGTLHISIPTVKRHLSNIFYKLDVRSRTQAVTQAQRWGMF